jgi:hypothetical protein
MYLNGKSWWDQAKCLDYEQLVLEKIIDQYLNVGELV